MSYNTINTLNAKTFKSYNNIYALLKRPHKKHSHMQIIYGHFDYDTDDFIYEKVSNTGIHYNNSLYNVYYRVDNTELFKNPNTNQIVCSTSFTIINKLRELYEETIANPTEAPTIVPTVIPTEEPTIVPTLIPTEEPTLPPSTWIEIEITTESENETAVIINNCYFIQPYLDCEYITEYDFANIALFYKIDYYGPIYLDCEYITNANNETIRIFRARKLSDLS